MKKVEVKIKKISNEYNDIDIPVYETPGSAGMDVRAAVSEEVIIKSGSYGLVATNLSVEIPEGFEIQVRGRSGLAAKFGIGVLNAPGTIDSDYRGEIKVILFNFGTNDFIIRRGDRIAQLVLSKVSLAKFVIAGDLAKSKRGANGFGHSGKN
ncbi:MAG: dUTP diphosphatase [bacterium]